MNVWEKLSFSCVIVTFNSQDTVEECILSILAEKLEINDIIVANNASEDKTVEILKKKFSNKIKLIQNDQNLGFTKACNQATKIASNKYLLFLNPDTVILTNDFFSKIKEFIKDKENLGTVGFKFLNPDGSLQPSCGRFPTILRIIFDRIKFLNLRWGLQIRNPKFYLKPSSVDWMSASGLLIRKDVFEKVGGFNEEIFMYGEDFDLCFRLKQAGYKNYFFPCIQMMHNDSGKNIPLRKPHKYFHMRKGLLSFFKNYRSVLSFHFFQLLVKLESLVFLLLLPFRGMNSEERNLWRKYLVKSLNIKI